MRLEQLEQLILISKEKSFNAASENLNISHQALNTSIKKLEEERQNLVRVTDILSELTRQLEPLEKQSETARVYLSKRETLKELDVNMFAAINNSLINDGCGLFRGRLILPYEHLSRFQNDLID